jgi:hypothetical protein
LRLPAYSASAKVICFIGKLGGWGRGILPNQKVFFRVSLANGVAKGDTFAGATAISFMKMTASNIGAPVSDADVARILNQMARGYLSALDSKLETNGGSPISSDVTYQEAWGFHTKVFEDNGLSKDAWTLNSVLSNITENTRESYWQNVLDSAGDLKKELLLAINTVQLMSLATVAGSGANKELAQSWINKVDSPTGYYNVVTQLLNSTKDPALPDAKTTLDNIRKIEIEPNGDMILTVPLSSSSVGEATLLYTKDSVQVSVAGISLMEVPKDSIISVGKQNVSVSHSYGDLSAAYRLTAQGVVVAWKNAEGGLAVEQTYGFDGLPVNTTWKQNGQTFTGPSPDLAAFISQTSTQTGALVLSQTVASQQAQTGTLLNTSAEGAIAAAENALSLTALQHRLAQEPYSDRWSPTALGASIPFALRLSNGLQAAIQQVINIAQQGWSTYNVGIVTILPLEVSGSGRYHLPLVLDLTGSGIKLLPPSQSNAVFDHNADGAKSAVGWVGADNGILVFDTNGNGAIDNATEWFGESFAVPGSKAPVGKNGFSALATLAAAGSTVFSRDTALINPLTGGSYFDGVKVWVDADQNGISTPDELKTLTSLGIASIDLISTHDGRQVGGGLIDSTAGLRSPMAHEEILPILGWPRKPRPLKGQPPSTQPWLKALANHGQFLLRAPAASPLLAQKLPTLIVAVSHKHNRLPIPYRKGETVSCLSWGSFILHGGSSCCSLTGKAVATYRSCIGMSVLTVTIGCVRVYRIARQSSSAFFMTRRHSDAAP